MGGRSLVHVRPNPDMDTKEAGGFEERPQMGVSGLIRNDGSLLQKILEYRNLGEQVRLLLALSGAAVVHANLGRANQTEYEQCGPV